MAPISEEHVLPSLVCIECCQHTPSVLDIHEEEAVESLISNTNVGCLLSLALILVVRTLEPELLRTFIKLKDYALATATIGGGPFFDVSNRHEMLY
jgi:hypothetical protein